jgi:hypothetical protein
MEFVQYLSVVCLFAFLLVVDLLLCFFFFLFFLSLWALLPDTK